MKKRLTWLPAIFLAMLFANCEDEADYRTSKDLNDNHDTNSGFINFKAFFSEDHTLKWGDACGIAEESADFYFSKDISSLKSGRIKRKVTSGNVVKRQKSDLRNANVLLPDTLAYICNFADSSGFAIICADDRVSTPILACVDKGMLGDTIDNPGLALFLENMYDYVESSILDFELKKDSLQDIALEILKKDSLSSSLKPTYSGTFTYINDEEVKPLLKTRWGQSGSPYNDLTPKCDEYKNTPAGCWATAISQIFAYYKFPLTISYVSSGKRSNCDMTWGAILQYTNADNDRLRKIYQKQVSRLLYGVGVNIGMDYSCAASGASADDAMKYMNNVGYSGCSSHGYDFSIVREQLKNKRPVLLAENKNITKLNNRMKVIENEIEINNDLIKGIESKEKDAKWSMYLPLCEAQDAYQEFIQSIII